MPSRRFFLGTMLAAGLSPALAVPANVAWRGWCDRHLRGGRVVDWRQGISHSEGQGYGLLLAQAAGDRAAFDRIEAWTQAHLAIRDDRLMAWSWRPQDGQTDWRNATDGDIFRAWALLRAHRDSGWTGYRDTALGIARDIADLCLAPDPRAPDEWLVLPGAEARRAPDRVLLNPSYIMPRALRELGRAANEASLLRAADHGETVLAELAGAGRLWDWLDVTAQGFAPADGHRAGWGYDALRVPLYLAWSGRGDHPAVRAALRLLEGGARPGHVVAARGAKGTPEAHSDNAGFVALPRLARCLSLPDRMSEPADYYADTLLMLCHVAMREGGCAS